jgi:hypothetical protein
MKIIINNANRCKKGVFKMSAFIGPIHYWLFNKIRLVADREEYLFGKAYEMCGSTAEEICEQVWQTFGEPLSNADLDDLVDHSNIHGWLQRQINIAESREAALIKALIDTCDCAAADLIEQAFEEHGKKTGQIAKTQEKYQISSAPGIYKALNDFYLNGMPCDQADMIIESQPDSLVWETSKCLQAPNWKRAGVDDKAMAKFYKAWITAFIEGISPAFTYVQTINDNHSTETVKIRNEIIKK